MREESSENSERTVNDAESAIANLIGRLPKVEAPADFDIKVRARIAEGRDNRKSGFAWLRLAFPVAGLALVAGFFGVASYWRLGDDVAMVAEPSRNETAPVAPEIPVVTVSSPAANAAVSERTIPANTQPSVPSAARPPDEENRDRRLPGPSDSATSEDQAFSTDTSLRPPRSIEVPSEVRSAPTSASPRGATDRKEQPSSGVALAQALSFAGVTVESSGGRLLVSSVSPKGAGALAGLKSGDVIESVNDRAPAAGEEYAVIRTITVIRGGQRVRISLALGQ